TWQVNLQFPRYSDEGTWHMEVDARDAAGNAINYLPSQLEHAYAQLRIAPPPRPAITSEQPFYGREAGGTTVTLTGTSFEEVSSVKFGSKPATSVTVNSPTSITAIAPTGEGEVDIRVVNPGGTSPTVIGDKFDYVPNVTPAVTKVSPTK